MFGSVDRAYLIRGWVIGGIFFALLLMASGGSNTSLTILYAINTVLFPFSKLVWDELKGFALGQTMLVLPALFLYIAKLFVNVLLWGFAIFIAPVGILWVWYRAK